MSKKRFSGLPSGVASLSERKEELFFSGASSVKESYNSQNHGLLKPLLEHLK